MLRLIIVRSPIPVLHLLRCRFVLSVFYLHLLYAPATFPQRSSAAFGPVSDFHLGYRPLGFAAGVAGTSAPEIAVIAQEQPALRFYDFTAAGRFTTTTTLTLDYIPRHIIAADFDRDGLSEYVLLSADGNSIAVIRHSSTGRRLDTYPLPDGAQKLEIADLNNNRRLDILAFGKATAGVLTMLAQPDGSFKAGPRLFPEISVSDLHSTDINGDGIIDFLLLNWLSNRLTVVHGITRMVFSELVSVPLRAEPADLAATPIGKDRSFTIAITFPEENEVALYSGNPIGDYRFVTAVRFGGRCAGVALTDINQDSFLDVVTTTRHGVEVAPGLSSSSFLPPTAYGVATSIVGWSLVDLDQDGRRDCLLIDRTTRRLLALGNSEYSGRYEWPHEYAVGLEPRGLFIGDVNRDGRQDIGVVNSGSASISILLNRGRGRFSGQRTIQLPDKPIAATLVPSKNRSEATIITTHPYSDRVAVVSLTEEIFRSRTDIVPTGLDPFVMFSRRDSDLLRFAVRHRSTRDKSAALSMFEQLSQRQFLEQSVRSTAPTKIVALNLEMIGDDGKFELLTASHDKASRVTTVSSSLAEAGMTFGTSRTLFSFADSLGATRMVMGAKINDGSQKGVVVVLGPPRNEMGIWISRHSATQTDTLEWFRNVQPLHEDVLFFADVNGDNVTDLLWLDGVRRSVLVSYGMEHRGFRAPTTVIAAEDVAGMRVGSLREAGVSDLVLSSSTRGTVTVIFSPFQR